MSVMYITFLLERDVTFFSTILFNTNYVQWMINQSARLVPYSLSSICALTVLFETCSIRDQWIVSSGTKVTWFRQHELQPVHNSSTSSPFVSSSLSPSSSSLSAPLLLFVAAFTNCATHTRLVTRCNPSKHVPWGQPQLRALLAYHGRPSRQTWSGTHTYRLHTDSLIYMLLR